VGARSLLRASAEVVTREQAQLVRLLLMCAAWAIGQMLVYEVLTQVGGVPGADLVLPAALAIGAYVLTEDRGRPRQGRGNARYWRGRRIDDPPKRDRRN
jgi:hypothetical protein